jgi:hypothetical protein
MSVAAVGRLLSPVTGRTVASTYLAHGWPDAQQVRLIASVREHGILVPVQVAGAWLRDGTHRYWAAIWLHLATMPVIGVEHA